MSSTVDPDNCILFIKTVQKDNIRILFDTLKEILNDINIIFTTEHIKIKELDDSSSAFVYMKLYSKQFEIYKCKDLLAVSINTKTVFKYIKTMDSDDDSITFFVEKDKTEFGIILENDKNKSHQIHRLKMMDIPLKSIEAPDKEFDYHITMPSLIFHKICKDYHSLGADEIIIESIGEQMIFKINTLTGASQKTIGTTESLTFDKSNKSIIFYGKFKLQFLLIFSKSHNLSSTVTFYLINDYPIILEYSIGSLGVIKFCLAPVVNTSSY